MKPWNEWNDPMYLVRLQNSTTPLENSLTASYKLSKRSENICPHKALVKNIQNRFTHNSPKLKTIQILIIKLLDKQIVFYSHNTV